MSTILEVGDRILFTQSYGSKPEAGKVTRVTKKWAYVTLGNGRTPPAFLREFHGDNACQAQRSSRRALHKHSLAYLDTPERRHLLNEQYEMDVARQVEKKAERDQARAKLIARLANELAEVRKAMDTPSGLPAMKLADTMPDGSRMYGVDIPVHANYAEYKKGWERVTIRVRTVERTVWDTGPRGEACVECAYTYCNGGSHSFSSVSTSQFDNDEDAVWDAIRRCYHSR